VALAFTGVDLLAGTSVMRGPWSRTLVMSTDHKETRSTERPQDFFGATGTDPLQRPLPLPPRIALGTVAWGGALKPRWRNNIMTRQLLAIAALSIALGFSVTTTNAAPASSMFEKLKTSAVEGSTVQQVRHYRHYRRGYRYGNCWWRDPWLCRYMW